MAKSKQRLGKGFSELFGEDMVDFINDIENNNYDKDAVVQVPLNEISPNPYQPRKVFNDEKLDELAKSIKEHGVFQPIIIKKADIGYNIIAGERRYRASQLVGLETIPALIVDFNEKQMMEIALLENIQRVDLNPLDEAIALKQIMDFNDYTQQELADKMGKSRADIANSLRLLSLSENVKQVVREEKITKGHAKVLSGLDDETLDQVVKEIIDKDLSVRSTEELVKSLKQSKPVKKPKDVISPEYKEIESKIREKFGTKIKLDHNSISIKFDNDDDLSRILELLDINLD